MPSTRSAACTRLIPLPVLVFSPNLLATVRILFKRGSLIHLQLAKLQCSLYQVIVSLLTVTECMP